MPSLKHILTQNHHSESFNVICFSVNEPQRGYIVQYNNNGLECEGLEDIAKIAVLDDPTLI